MKQKILIAPLNWGLGHATRCIPIIRSLLICNYTPILASDGAALALLKKEFPELEAIELPSYNITYTKNGNFLKLKLLLDGPKIIKAISAEKRALETIVKTHHIDGIISDNRFGMYHKGFPSVFITHQLQVLSGTTTWLSTRLHQRIIKKFDACWVPDYNDAPQLSGIMGQAKNAIFKIHYLGPLSRFEKQVIPYEFDVMVLLSGPEPQREILETILLTAFEKYNGKVLFVRGVVESEQTCRTIKNITIYNYMTTPMLEHSLNVSKLIVARSGYTTIMDLAKLEKKAFFIPTPGQPEQMYLAQLMLQHNYAAFCRQEEFTLDKLGIVDRYAGFKSRDDTANFAELFRLFERK
ncbi:glycosyltransferase [Gelidibacter salicanalis]|uniref:Glycosyltransferase n=1 Tax=Gelidibacter salicanalis TaxID=291193 RepID=A0A5C7AMM1_9FLAO|nr:glycosyltransferase [Gelidibacter salicanalis]TXE09029.1 glycosyltransferase [Gelidibacter salicanalis]